MNQLTLIGELDNYPEEILLLLNKTVLARGKRLRPLLTYLVADLFDVELSNVTPFARAIELLHGASLAHDDVIDNATYRRGHPSINVVASNKKAVLAGDLLFAEVITQVTNQGHLFLAREIAAVIKQLATGEWLQLHTVEQKYCTQEIINQIAQMKTASVIIWCCLVGPSLALSPQLIIDQLRLFGQNLGMAFQLRDDILDFTGSDKKNALLDLENGIVNAVTYSWFQHQPTFQSKFYQGESLIPYTEDSMLVAAISQTASKAQSYLEQARGILDELGEFLIHEKKLPKLEIQAKLVPLKSLLQHLQVQVP